MRTDRERLYGREVFHARELRHERLSLFDQLSSIARALEMVQDDKPRRSPSRPRDAGPASSPSGVFRHQPGRELGVWLSELRLEPSGASVHNTHPAHSRFPSCLGTRVRFLLMLWTELDTAIDPGPLGTGRETGIGIRTHGSTTTKATMTGVVGIIHRAKARIEIDMWATSRTA